MKSLRSLAYDAIEIGFDGGRFILRSADHGRALNVIISNGGGWDHVSVSMPNRTPTWADMEQVKRFFFEDHETVMQLHVPVTDHISHHPHCLHLWRPQHEEIPRPPSIFVGPS